MNKKILYPLITLIVITAGIAIWQKRRIIRHAKKFLGISEIGDNQDFSSPEFKQKLINVGWSPGLAYCAFTVKALMLDTYPELSEKTYNSKKLIDYFSGSSQSTYANMQQLQSETGLFTVGGLPKPGDVVIWQDYDASGNGTANGHEGVVTKVNGDKFSTIEANTSELGSSDQGVYNKEHSLGEMARTTGLKLKGFIHYTLA